MSLLRSAVPVVEDTLGDPRDLLRPQVLALAALGPLVAGYAAVTAVLVLVTSMAPMARFTTSGVLAASSRGWLAAYQVPLRIEGHELGALPLLPTVAAVALIWRTALDAARRLDTRTPVEAAELVLAIVGGHAVFGAVLGVAAAGGAVTVNLLAAVCYPALFAAVAAIAGAARHGGLAGLVLGRIGDVAGEGLRVGGLAVAVLLAAGAGVLALGLVGSVGVAGEMFARNAGGFGAGLGMLLLCAGYLPNGVLAGMSFVAGTGFSIGEISVTPLNFSGGPVPGLPLLAALPERPAGWWTMLLVVPVGTGALVGRLSRDVSAEPARRLRAAAVAVGVLTVSLVVLAGWAGGALGGGRFDPVDLHPARLAVALLAWVGVVAAVVAAIGSVSGPEPDDREPSEADDTDEDTADDTDGTDASEIAEGTDGERPADAADEPVKRDLAVEAD